MTDEDKTLALSNAKAETLLIDLFKKIESIRMNDGAEVAEQVVFTLVSSMIATQVLHTVQTCETIEGGAKEYMTAKRCTEAAVRLAFERVFTELNPGSTPEFNCDVQLLDDGIDSSGISC